MSFHNKPDYHIPELIEALKAHRLPHDTPSQLADSFRIGWMARASHGQAPAQPDPAYSAACHLATALFKKHFAHLPDFASGQAAWSLCDSTAGVILQIDNMVAGLVQPPTTSPQADSVQEDALDAEALRDAERHRFIRDVPYSDDVRSVLVHQQNAAMDRVIDAALAAIKQGEKQ